MSAATPPSLPRHAGEDPLVAPEFTERAELLRASQFWPAARLADFQLAQLQRLARYCQERIPFYRDALRSAGALWTDLRSLDDIKMFPIIDKSVVVENADAFIPEGVDRDELICRSTGGSSGTPLRVYSDIAHYAKDKANTNFYMEVFGLDIFNYRSARIYGDVVDGADEHRPWRIDGGRRLVMSCYHITPDTAAGYVEALNAFEPRYIHCRPSAILPLARQILDQDLLLRPIRNLFCDGEYLTDGQRRLIERAFQGRLANVYGHTEGCVFGFPCPHSDALHFPPQVGVLELLNEARAPVTSPGLRGEMVTTGFNNAMTPLVRYATGDIAIRGASACCDCGRDFPLLERVEGRLQDYVVTRSGALTPLAPAVFNYNDVDWRDVKEFRVRQERRGELTFQLVPIDLAARDRLAPPSDFTQALQRLFGDRFALHWEFADELPRTRVGKHRYLDQRLPIDLRGLS